MGVKNSLGGLNRENPIKKDQHLDEGIWEEALVLCIVGVILCAVLLYLHYRDLREEKETFKQLAVMAELWPEGDTVSWEEEGNIIAEGENDNTAGDPCILEQYAGLYALNPDMIGWIQIEGTTINYPVMQSIEEPDYYLHRDFYGEYSKSGVPYLEEECDLSASGGNWLIYGHYMKNGTMFTDLKKYRDEEFYREHPFIRFDTLKEEGEYQVIAVLRTVVYHDGPEAFRYYDYIDLDEESFAEYVNRCKELSYYDTGESAEYGDQLLTLSTCDFTVKNGRLVVVARKRVE